MTRKEQIEQFLRECRERDPKKKTPHATREEFLAYGFIRGRYYKQIERQRGDSTKGVRDILHDISRSIYRFFPHPDPVPVPVPADDVRPPRVGPDHMPWPEVAYGDGLMDQLLEWIAQTAPDQKRWELREEEYRAQWRRRKAANAQVFKRQQANPDS